MMNMALILKDFIKMARSMTSMDLVKEECIEMGHINNEEGYDREGYDKKGYDRNGFNSAGFDKEGYNKKWI